MSDIDLMNGMITPSTLVHETPHQKEYRIIAVLTAEPDLSRYPFDKHTLPVKLEPRENHEDRMVVVNDASENGINPDADIPGWRITGSGCSVTNMTYLPGEVPFSRIVHEYWIERDAMSTSLRFFIPLILIVIVSLSLSLSLIASHEDIFPAGGQCIDVSCCGTVSLADIRYYPGCRVCDLSGSFHAHHLCDTGHGSRFRYSDALMHRRKIRNWLQRFTPGHFVVYPTGLSDAVPPADHPSALPVLITPFSLGLNLHFPVITSRISPGSVWEVKRSSRSVVQES